MKREPLLAWAGTLLRCACGLVLLAASADKLDAAEKFAKVIENYKIVSPALVPLFAATLPWVEFFCGACLLLGFRWRGAALLFCALMAFYTGALSFNLLRGVDMACGCFSVDSTTPVTWGTVARDAGFLVLGLGAWFAPASRAELDGLLSRRRPPPG